MRDDPERRRWLASSFDGVDALTDDLVREAARLLTDAMDSNRLVGEARKDAVIPAVEHCRRCNALWDDFGRQHGLTVKPPLRSPKGTRRPGEPG
jgi:hypothetical protein